MILWYCGKTIHPSVHCPAGIFDSGSVLLNQNVNGCVRTYVNHSRTVAERIKPIRLVQNWSRGGHSGHIVNVAPPGNWFRIGSALNRYNICSGLVRTSFRACRDMCLHFPSMVITPHQIRKIRKTPTPLTQDTWNTPNTLNPNTHRLSGIHITCSSSDGLSWPSGGSNPRPSDYEWAREVVSSSALTNSATETQAAHGCLWETPQTLMLVVKGTVSMSCPHVCSPLRTKRDNYYYYCRIWPGLHQDQMPNALHEMTSAKQVITM